MEIPEALSPFSLHTSANDYAKFLATLMADKQAVQLIVQSPASVVPRLGLGWGLGWGVEHGEKEIYIWQPIENEFVLYAMKLLDAKMSKKWYR